MYSAAASVPTATTLNQSDSASSQVLPVPSPRTFSQSEIRAATVDTGSIWGEYCVGKESALYLIFRTASYATNSRLCRPSCGVEKSTGPTPSGAPCCPTRSLFSQ